MTTDFGRLTDPFRHELLVYCYRMLGSVHDAEDLVQEVYLRAWRSYADFEGRASLRTWLYRIATNACLNALRHGSRRMLPSGLPGDTAEVPWLEPIPDNPLGVAPDDPAAVVAARTGVRLAFIAALQHLPPAQRAVLILRDVLTWPAAEVADLLGTTPTAVHSQLRRARARLERAAPVSDDISEPGEWRDLLDRYVKAMENADIPALTELLTEDAIWEMPPNPAWYQTPARIGPMLGTRLRAPGYCRLLPTRANGRPAFGMYINDAAFAVQVLEVTAEGISHVVSFHDATLLARFGLPATYPAPDTPTPSDRRS